MMKDFSNLFITKIVLISFIILLIFITIYELFLVNIPASNFIYYKIGIISANISYSLIAASLFFYISYYFPIYLPLQKKKIKLLYSIYKRTMLIKIIISDLEFHLELNKDIVYNNEKFEKILDNINTNSPVNIFPNWYSYLNYIKNDLLEIIRSISIYNEYLSTDFLQELLLIEEQLLTKYNFSGHKFIGVDNLSFAKIAIQELFIHNYHLQEIKDIEFKKYKYKFDILGKKYRKKYYK